MKKVGEVARGQRDLTLKSLVRTLKEGVHLHVHLHYTVVVVGGKPPLAATGKRCHGAPAPSQKGCSDMLLGPC